MRAQRFSVLICFLLSLFAGPVLKAQETAADVFVISAPSATLYAAPSEARKTPTVLNRGRRVQAAGPEQNGFIPVMTRTGAQAWVKAADVTAELSSDVIEPAPPQAPRRGGAPSPRTRRGASPARERGSLLGLHRITFDLGASTGSVGNVSYTEIGLGLNLYFSDWLAWRNALFGRFPSTGTSVYGLDSSVRGILGLEFLTAFAGPGYRFVNQGTNVPFGEAGLVLKLGGFSLGGGVKVLLTSWVLSGAPNDTQYFLILAGGGSL